ncbi:MAG TPA: di-heme oxidoredictase family protein [Candidatus Polarisedimenticolia bacterium]|nr:di-heme oxidoredictase family protein [Candidatus Polarisedimenticolia bacterium]
MIIKAGFWSTALGVTALLFAIGCARPPKPGEPLRGLTRVQRDRFDRGRLVFTREFTPETGLGPLFNAVACGECHEDPASGGIGDEVEIHAAASRPDGTCDALTDLGGPVYQLHVTPALKAALGIDEEPIPSRATARARRTTPPLMGLGLLDAVPDEEILDLADPDDRDHDGVSGRPNRSPDGRIGRFGRKAFVPTLREFNTGAFLFEQGVTSPDQPVEETVAGTPLPPGVDPVPEPEISGDDLLLADAFVRFLAPPAPERPAFSARQGERVFESIRCVSCHRPWLRTGDSPVRALRHKKVGAYTDLLLHDMGPDLADVCLGLATPAEFRTEPLMGLRLRGRFLHDGRAATIEAAIRLHGGEGTRARDRFAALSDSDRRAVLEFLGRL